MDHLLQQLLSPSLPFRSVVLGINQILVRTHTKDFAFLKLFGQGDDVVVKKVQFSLVPKDGGIGTHTTLLEGLIQLQEQTLVPLAVDVPVLHRMRNIAGLDQMLNNDGGSHTMVLGVEQLGRERLVPTILAQVIELLVENICRQLHKYKHKSVHDCGVAKYLDVDSSNKDHGTYNRIDHDLTETEKLLLRFETEPAQTSELIAHQQRPGQI